MGKFLASTPSGLSLQSPSKIPNKLDPKSRSGPIRSSSKPEHRSRNKSLLELWHSQEFERHLPEVTDIPRWVEDGMKFSKRLEAPMDRWSLWRWMPFRALAHIGLQRTDFVFSLQIHAIQGLPSALNSTRVIVRWRRKDKSVETTPAMVFQGAAAFKQALHLTCGVYASRNAPHAIKHVPLICTLSVFVVDREDILLGKHQLDLAKILPQSVDQTAENEDYLMHLKLSRKAKDAILTASIGYDILDKNRRKLNSKTNRFKESPVAPSICSSGSLHSSVQGTPCHDSIVSRVLSPTVSAPTIVSASLQPSLFYSSESEAKILKNGSVQAPSTPVQLQEHLRMNRKSYVLSELDERNAGDEAAGDEAAGAMKQNAVLEVLSTTALDEVAKSEQEEEVDEMIRKASYDERVENMGTTLVRGSMQEILDISTVDLCNYESTEVDVPSVRAFNKQNQCSGSQVQTNALESFQWPKAHSDKSSSTISATVCKEKFVLEEANASKRCENTALLDLDGEAELIAGEFLDMLEKESSLDGSSARANKSSKAEALKNLQEEFTFGVMSQEAELNIKARSENRPVELGYFKHSLRKASKYMYSNKNVDVDSILKGADLQQQKENQIVRRKAQSKPSEEAETEASMHAWMASQLETVREIAPTLK